MSKLKGILAQSGAASQLLVLMSFTCFLTISGMIIWTVFMHGNLSDISSMKWLQLIQSVGMFVLPPIGLAYLCSVKPVAFLHFNKKINWIDLLLVVLIMLLVIPFINLVGDLNRQVVLPKIFLGIETWMKTSEEQAAVFTEKLLNVHEIQSLIFNMFLIALIPAMGEELFFRGAVQGVLHRKFNAKIAIWITAIVFSAIHLQFYGFIPRMLLGAFFGYLLFWSENMWLPILAHFTNNVIAVIFYYLKNNGCKLPDLDAVGTGNTWWLGVASGALAIFGFFYLKNRFLKEEINNQIITVDE